MFRKVAEIVFPGKKVIVKDDIEPQSEAEEIKEELGFKQTIAQECDNYITAVSNLEIVQEADIAQLVVLRDIELQQIERLAKFKPEGEGVFKESLKFLTTKISQLEIQLEGNKKLASLILIEIKVVFANALAKLVGTPVQSLCLNTREVKVVTNMPGTGDDYQHPTLLDFENPIDSVYHVSSNSCYLKFGTKDGVIGVQPKTTNVFARVAISPATPIAKIEVWYVNIVHGIKFWNKEGVCTLSAGHTTTGTKQEILLQQGERLVGIKSKLHIINNI